MSHTTSIQSIKIMNIEALKAAVAELAKTGIKISLKTGGTPRSYSVGQAGMGAADFVIEIPDAKYDIGLYKQADGNYEARTDFWSGSVEHVLGAKASSPDKSAQAKLGKLYQMYGIHAATMEARKKGYMVQRKAADAQGNIKLQLMLPA